MLRFFILFVTCIFLSACSAYNHNKNILDSYFKQECVLEIPVVRMGNTFISEYNGNKVPYINVSKNFDFVSDDFKIGHYKYFGFFDNKTMTVLLIRKDFGIFKMEENCSQWPNTTQDHSGSYVCVRKKQVTNKMDLIMYVQSSSKGDRLLSVFKYHDTTAMGFHNIEIRHSELLPYNISKELLLNSSNDTDAILDNFEQNALQQFTILPR